MAEASSPGETEAASGPDAAAAAAGGGDQERRGDWALMSRFTSYFAGQRATLVAIFFVTLLGVVAEVFQPLVLKYAIDDVIAPGNVAGLAGAAALFLGVVLLTYGARSLGLYLLLRLGLRTLALVRRDVFLHVMGQGQRFFDRRTTGSLMTRTTNDVEAVYESLAMGAINLVTDALKIVGMLVAMLALDPLLTVVSFAFAPIIVVAVNICRKQLRRLSLIIRTALSRLNGFFAEQINGMSLVQLYGAQDRARDDFRALSYEYLDAYRKSNWWDAGLYAVMDGMSALAIGLMLWLGASRFVEPESGITLGLLVAFIDYLQRVFVPIREFSGRLATIQRAAAGLERIAKLLDAEDRVGEGEIRMPEVAGAIALEDVRFRYAEDRPLVLHGVDFEVQPGEVVAIVGATGSGKTTIGKLLTRMYDGYEGSLRLDGRELRDVDLNDLRRAVTVVHQDVFLFAGSVAENIGLWSPQIDRARIESAAALARADGFIRELPRGYDAQIAERGGNLSSGQKQLLAISRALARDAPIVILDEATASVDSVTEKLIDQAIDVLLEQKTVLIIAHRLSTITKADRIVVLHHGRVVEQGTHTELLALGGRYKLLVETGFDV